MQKLITQSVDAPEVQELQQLANAKLDTANETLRTLDGHALDQIAELKQLNIEAHQSNQKLDEVIRAIKTLAPILLSGIAALALLGRILMAILLLILLIAALLAWYLWSQKPPPASMPPINKFSLVMPAPTLRSTVFNGPTFDEAASDQCLHGEKPEKRPCELVDWKAAGLGEPLEAFLQTKRRIVLVTIEAGHDRKPLAPALRKSFDSNLGLARSRGEFLKRSLEAISNSFPIVITVRPALESEPESFSADRKVKIAVLWEPLYE